MSGKKKVGPRYANTMGVTQELNRDIIQFLSKKHTANATLTVKEIMSLYDCPEDRAMRVIASLVEESVLVPDGPGIYRVTI